jgi:hypothetical protein
VPDTAAPPAAPAAHPRLWPSPWPAEDGGPERAQQPHGLRGLGLRDGERLRLAARRDAPGTTMVVLRDPGEVYVLRHTIGRRPLTDPATAWVERVDPETLAPVACSPQLPAGPFWPGGLAAHGDGTLHVVFGTYCHRLSPELDLLASRRLPGERPYNSFAVLPDGSLAMKDFDRGADAPARLVVLDPRTLERRAADLVLPEAAIARLSADGEGLVVVGARTLMRIAWDGDRLRHEDRFDLPYDRPGRSYGWDPVIAGGHVWFLDNGAHDFATTMRGAGVAPGRVHLWRVALENPSDHECVPVCDAPRGAVTNPPLYDAARRIAVAYDSANGVVQAFRFDGALNPLWRRELSHAAHMVLFGDTGELVLGDFHGPAFGRTRLGRAMARRTTVALRRPRVQRVATTGSREDVVVVDIESGAERGRVGVPSLLQSVVFPAPGFERDLYWCSMSTLARVTAG